MRRINSHSRSSSRGCATTLGKFSVSTLFLKSRHLFSEVTLQCSRYQVLYQISDFLQLVTASLTVRFTITITFNITFTITVTVAITLPGWWGGRTVAMSSGGRGGRSLHFRVMIIFLVWYFLCCSLQVHLCSSLWPHSTLRWPSVVEKDRQWDKNSLQPTYHIWLLTFNLSDQTNFQIGTGWIWSVENTCLCFNQSED